MRTVVDLLFSRTGIRPIRVAIVTYFVLSSTALPAAKDEQRASYERAADAHGLTVFLREGGWCWFQDPRVIVHSDKLLVGGVQGNGSGDAVVGVYDLQARKPLGRVVLHAGFKRDDHNSPVFYARPDGSVLAVYALHGGDKIHSYRISDPNDGKHEIYRAEVGPGDSTPTIRWEPLTRNSPVRNIRPFIATGNGYRVLLWLRGDFVTYTDYQLDVVGVVEKLD